MSKADFIDRVAEKAELTRSAAAKAVEAIFDTASGAISEAVHAAGTFSIPGFGKFTKKTRAARTGRNPRTGAVIKIPERASVSFTAGKGLKSGTSTSRRKTTTASSSGTARKAAGARKSSGTAASKSTTARKSSSGTARKASGASASRGTAAKSTSRSTAAKKSTGGARKTTTQSTGTARKSTGGTAAKKSSASARKTGGRGR